VRRLGVRRPFIFVRTDGSRLVWKSRSGEDKLKQLMVDKLISFARSRGLMH
jgi:hypothetical protein